MIGQIIAVTLSCFLVGAILMALANLRVEAEIQRQRWLKLATYFIIVHLVLGSAVLGRPWLIGLMVTILLAGTWELRRALLGTRHELRGLRWRVWPTYAALSGALLFTVGNLPPEGIAFLYLVVASSDGFSQVIGQLLGRHRLAPAVSPSKTVEGLFGGIFGALIIVWIFRELVGLAAPTALIVGVAIALCGLAGDLSASWVKRRAGIKDFSALLPAHGGVLDRFDSFIGAGALVGPALYALSGPVS